MKLSRKKVLVTGSEGFIGSHLVETLVRQGHDVRAFVLYNSFDNRGWLEDLSPEVQSSIEIVFGDVRDSNSVRQAMNGCDIVFHLAALIGIPYSYAAPESYVDVNVKGTLHILQAARDLGVERVVHTSTSETYGSAQYVPIDEHHPLVGQSPYSASKIAADQIAYSFWSSFQVPVSIVRPFNTYGPRQSTRAVIPTIITQIASGSQSIDLGNGSPTRDFSFVGDTVDGFITIANSDSAVGEVLNLGSGFEISISDTFDLISELMGSSATINMDLKRLRPDSSEVTRLYADNSKTQEMTGWQPSYAGLDGFRRGLALTVDWFREPANLNRYRSGNYTV